MKSIKLVKSIKSIKLMGANQTKKVYGLQFFYLGVSILRKREQNSLYFHFNCIFITKSKEFTI